VLALTVRSWSTEAKALDFDLVPMLAFSEAGRIHGALARTCRDSTTANGGFSRG
jgi:hypothetical protein